MDEQQQNSYEGFSPTMYGAAAPARVGQVPASAALAPIQLRPLSTGEILDRTFTLYRRNFWLFVAIGMLPAATVAATSAARMIYVSLTHRVTTVGPGASAEALAQTMNTLLVTQVYFLPALVLFVIVYGLSQAATIHAVGRLTRGNRTTAGEAYRATRGQWLRWSGIALRWGWSATWPVTLVVIVLTFAVPFARGNSFVIGTLTLLGILFVPAALVFGVINLLRNALGMPAGVEEDSGVSASMRRSKVLVAGRKGRIFLTLLLVYAMQMVAGALQLPFVLLATTTRGAEHIVLQAAQLLISFVTTALVSPVASIALTLLYMDERVRREGYDIELLMQHSLTGGGVLTGTGPRDQSA